MIDSLVVRNSQTTKVIAYRLPLGDSIEKIRELQKCKPALAEDVLGEKRFEATSLYQH